MDTEILFPKRVDFVDVTGETYLIRSLIYLVTHYHMKTLRTISVMTLSVIALILGLSGPITTFAATAPTLGAAASYAVFGKAGVTNDSNVGVTHIWGNVGADAVNVTNLNDATQVDGIIDAGAGVEADILIAYGQLAAIPDVPVVLNLAGNNTVAPGVYDVGATTLNGVLTLSGAGVYVFRSSSSVTVTPGVGAEVKLTNGADACNVFWQIPASMTIGAGAKIIGTIVTDTALISLGTNATLQGRALSRISQVTMLGNQITEPTCTPPPATLRIIKQVVNTGGGTATAATFNLHVKLAGVDVAGSPAMGTIAPGTSYSLSAGAYVVSEDANALYTRSFGGDCDASGTISLLSGDNKTCTITNTYIPPPVSSGGGGNLRVDVCPEGDYSYSYYDGICGTAPIVADRIVPLIGIIKVPTPLALPAGSGSVTYNYVIWNVGGKQALTSVSIADDKCSPVKLLSGDINNNHKLDPTEKWKYSCTSTLSETTTNTAVASGYSDDAYHQLAVATAVATVVVGMPLTPPLISIVKVPSRLTPFPFGGGDVTYTYKVRNPGIVAMHDIVVTDDKCTPVSSSVGDANNNNLLDTTETWTYTCRTNVPVSTMNTATAKGQANGFTAIGHAFANVLVSPAVIAKITPRLPNTGLPQKEASIPWSMIALASILILASASLLIVLRKDTI